MVRQEERGGREAWRNVGPRVAAGVYRLGDGWAASVELGPGEDGKRRRRVVPGARQRDVLDQMKEIRQQVDAGLAVATSRGDRFGDYLEQSWLPDTLGAQLAAGKLRQATFDSYADLTRRYLIPALGRHWLAELKAPHVRAFLTGCVRGTAAGASAHGVATAGRAPRWCYPRARSSTPTRCCAGRSPTRCATN